METILRTSAVQNDAGLWVAETVARLGLTEVEERPYQAEALQALWDARANGATRGLVHLATGLGKTSVATLDVLRFGEAEFGVEEGQRPRVLFACHKEEILEQAADRFALFTPDASQGFYVGRRRELDADITFATMQSLFRRLGDLAQNYFDYVIYDEAHHTKAATFERVVEHFGPTFMLGLTATPNRADDLDIREFFGSELYSKGLAEGMAEGWLADVDYHIVFDDAVRAAIESNFDPKSLKELRALLKVDVRNEVIVENIKDKLKEFGVEGAKTIVFCEDIEHVDDIAEGLGGGSYHSGADKSEREELLARFKDGSLQFICTRDMFNEGVDIPDAEALVFLRGTGSETIFEQQLGRGLRKVRGRKDKVLVLDFVANVERIQAVRALSETVAKAEKSADWSSGETEEDGESGVGFSIHTTRGDFEFDSLAVQLMERFNFLRDKSDNSFAGLDNDELISVARAISPDKPLTSARINELSSMGKFVSPSTIHERFGSLTEFQQACGFDVSRVAPSERVDHKRLTNEDVVALALKLSPDRPLNSKEIARLSRAGKFISMTSVQTKFGSLEEFQRACGIGPREVSDLSNDELVALALELSPDKPLRQADLIKLSPAGRFVSQPTITKRFGSLTEFQKACGFDVAVAAKRTQRLRPKDLTNEDVVALALKLSPDRPLSRSDITQLSKDGKFISAGPIRVKFGSLTEFHKACGF